MDQQVFPLFFFPEKGKELFFQLKEIFAVPMILSPSSITWNLSTHLVAKWREAKVIDVIVDIVNLVSNS